MSGQFNGFTQADIRKVTSKIAPNRENGSKPILKKKLPQETVQPQLKPQNRPMAPPPPKDNPMNTTADSSMTSLQNAFRNAMEFNPPSVGGKKNVAEENTVKEIDSKTSVAHDEIADENMENGLPFEGMSLKDYETKNRMIKEQNKMKKEMLCKAIEQQTQRTAAEARKFKEIEMELKNLEAELTADVSLLRKHIEAASIRYMNAQKYYLQIESTFLKAKLELHETKEKKELLAEHLNVIIHSNEERKARKLAELMEKIGLTDEIQLPLLEAPPKDANLETQN